MGGDSSPPTAATAPSGLAGRQLADARDTYCVLGAGSSGLTVAKNFQQAGLACEVLEREDDVGGNWYYGKPHSSVYRSTHLISSKRMTQYTDFPMPNEYPQYPRHDQALEYLRSYARHFGLYELIRFQTCVERVEPGDEGWIVTLDDGRRRHYRGLVIANGHNWDPRWPDYPGSFAGQTLHSAQYKTPDLLVDKRVLVVGAGNSGCDIAVESARHARLTLHSLRRGYHFLPKFLNGRPIDQVGEWMLRRRVPLAVRRWLGYWTSRLALGTPESLGLPRPEHRLFETHPIINSQLFYEVAHGRIRPKPDVARLCGERVRFVDGTEEPIDVIIYATGFRLSFPFIDRAQLNWRDGRPQLYLNVFHPDRDDLFVAGLIQPDSGQWGLVDYQAQLIARYLVGLQRRASGARALQRRKRQGDEDLAGGIRYVRSTRHLVEVEHYGYRQLLKRWIRRLDR